MALSEASRIEIARKGAIPLLIALLDSTSEPKRRYASLALKYIVLDNKANGTEVVNRGGVKPLIALLTGSNKQKENAASVLDSLVQSEANRAVLVSSGVCRVTDLALIGNWAAKGTRIASVARAHVKNITLSVIKSEYGHGSIPFNVGLWKQKLKLTLVFVNVTSWLLKYYE